LREGERDRYLRQRYVRRRARRKCTGNTEAADRSAVRTYHGINWASDRLKRALDDIPIDQPAEPDDYDKQDAEKETFHAQILSQGSK